MARRREDRSERFALVRHVGVTIVSIRKVQIVSWEPVASRQTDMTQLCIAGGTGIVFMHQLKLAPPSPVAITRVLCEQKLTARVRIFYKVNL